MIIVNEQKIFIQKVKKSAEAHEGGAWKVAYADFVTAMMAFFLLMWLLNATTEKQRSGIADYFDPKVPISQTSAGGTGMFGGDSVFSQKRLARNGLGGAGKKAAAGRDDKEKQEVASSEDVWSHGEAKSEKIGNKKSEDISEAKKIETEIRRQMKALSPKGELLEHLNFKMTDEGLRIDIVDTGGESMFASGSDKPTPKMQQILQVVSSVIADTENKLSITGHTDSAVFKNRRDYGNWELSSDRANAARRILTQEGTDALRIKRVEGRADKEPFDKYNPDNASNRRIGIILLQNSTENEAK